MTAVTAGVPGSAARAAVPGRAATRTIVGVPANTNQCVVEVGALYRIVLYSVVLTFITVKSPFTHFLVFENR